MAGLIQISGTYGYTWYVFIWNASGQVWDGSSFVTYSSGSWSDYVVDLTEKSSSGYYQADFPGGITTPGRYHVTAYQVMGTVPGVGDVVVGSEIIYWDGTQVEQGSGAAIKTQQLSELSVGEPSVTPTVEQALMLLYMALKNKQITTTSDTQLYNSSGTMITKAALSYDGSTTITREAFGAP